MGATKPPTEARGPSHTAHPPLFQGHAAEEGQRQPRCPGARKKTTTSGASFLLGSQGIFLKRLFWFNAFEKNLVFLRHLPWDWGQTAEQRTVLPLVMSRPLVLRQLSKHKLGSKLSAWSWNEREVTA